MTAAFNLLMKGADSPEEKTKRMASVFADLEEWGIRAKDSAHQSASKRVKSAVKQFVGLVSSLPVYLFSNSLSSRQIATRLSTTWLFAELCATQGQTKPPLHCLSAGPARILSDASLT